MRERASVPSAQMHKSRSASGAQTRAWHARASLLQRYALYTNEPDGLAADLARYRAVTPQSIEAAMKRWLDPARRVEIETLPVSRS